MSDFATALVNAFMGPGQSPTDEQGNVDPALYYTYKSLVDITSKTARDFRAQETRAYIAELQNNVKVYNSAQKAMTDLVGYRTEAAIASARNITAIKVAAQKTADSLTKMLSTKSEDKINKIEQIAERNVASGNTNMGQEVVRAMLDESYESVDGINPDRTTKLATQNELLIKHVGTNFNDPNFSQKLDQVLSVAQDAGSIKERMLAQQAQWLNVNKVITDAHGLQGTLENYSNIVRDIQPGAPGSEEAIKQANAILVDALEKNQDLMTMRGERTQSALQEAQGWYSQYMTEVAKYEPVMQDIARRMMRQDPGKKNRAQLVNSENFQKWAQSNGFANTGYIQDGVYVEGADDTDAIALWLWQRKHPGKYRPGLIQPPSDTGQVLKIEQPLSEEAAAKFYNEDGQYLARRRGKELSYLTKDDPLLQLAEEGGLVVDTGDKTFVVKQSKVADEMTQEAVALVERVKAATGTDSLPAALDAIKKENPELKDKIVSQLRAIEANRQATNRTSLDTLLDVNGGYAEQLKKPIKDRDPAVMADLQAALGGLDIYEVTADGDVKAVRGVDVQGQVQEQSLEDPFYQALFDTKKTKELKGSELIDATAPTVVKTKKAPVKTVYAREQVLHANDVQRGQINQKLKVYDHELRDPVEATFNFDPKTGNATVVDSVDETLNGKKFQPEQAYGAGKARETEEEFVDDSKLGRKPRGKSEEEKALKDEEKAALAAGKIVEQQEQRAAKEDAQYQRQADKFTRILAKGLGLKVSSAEPDPLLLPNAARKEAKDQRQALGEDFASAYSSPPDLIPPNQDWLYNEIDGTAITPKQKASLRRTLPAPPLTLPSSGAGRTMVGAGSSPSDTLPVDEFGEVGVDVSGVEVNDRADAGKPKPSGVITPRTMGIAAIQRAQPGITDLERQQKANANKVLKGEPVGRKYTTFPLTVPPSTFKQDWDE